VARSVNLVGHLETEQFSIFLGKNFVVMFQEQPGDCFDPVRQRIRTDRGIIRSEGPDYLAYALVDAVIDSYYPVLEEYSDRMEALDEAVTDHKPAETIARIHNLRTELLGVRRAIWPHRELVNALIRDPHPLVHDTTRVYLRDCFDHSVQIIDMVETYREMCADLTDYAMTTAGTRLNEIMKVLTIIATIFIPLSFIASLYGMNFSPEASPLNMPELRWYWGYPFALSLMAAVAAALLGYFWHKGWIGASFRSPRQDRANEKGPRSTLGSS
jgi:magnesium transporter